MYSHDRTLLLPMISDSTVHMKVINTNYVS